VTRCGSQFSAGQGKTQWSSTKSRTHLLSKFWNQPPTQRPLAAEWMKNAVISDAVFEGLTAGRAGCAFNIVGFLDILLENLQFIRCTSTGNTNAGSVYVNANTIGMRRCTYRESVGYEASAYMMEGSVNNEMGMISCVGCSCNYHLGGHRYGQSLISTSNASFCKATTNLFGYHPYFGPKFHIAYLIYCGNSGGLIHSSYNLQDEEMTTERLCTTNNTANPRVIQISCNLHFVSHCFILEKMTPIEFFTNTGALKVRIWDCYFGVMPASSSVFEMKNCYPIEAIPDELAYVRSKCFLDSKSRLFTQNRFIDLSLVILIPWVLWEESAECCWLGRQRNLNQNRTKRWLNFEHWPFSSHCILVID